MGQSDDSWQDLHRDFFMEAAAWPTKSGASLDRCGSVMVDFQLGWRGPDTCNGNDEMRKTGELEP